MTEGYSKKTLKYVSWKYVISKIIITIYFRILTTYKLFIWKLSACHWISIKMIMLRDATHAWNLVNMMSTNRKYSVEYEIERECWCILIQNDTHFVWKKQHNSVYCSRNLFRCTSSQYRIEVVSYCHPFDRYRKTAGRIALKYDIYVFKSTRNRYYQ